MLYGNIFSSRDDAQQYLADLDSHAVLDYANRDEV